MCWEGKHFPGKLGTLLPLAALQLSLCLLQVPAMVRYIHQWLLSNECPEYRLSRTLLDLTEAYPTDVVMTILRVAPSCDRYGAHLPRRPRAHRPITLWSLSQVPDKRRVPGPSVSSHFPALSCQPLSLLPCSLPAPQGPVPTRVGCLGAAGEEQWAEAGLTASSGPCCCPGHGAVAKISPETEL